MKLLIITLMIAFVASCLLFSAAQTMTGYYAEPSGYGFYHIWAANLYVSLSSVLLGSVVMVFLARKIERRFF